MSRIVKVARCMGLTARAILTFKALTVDFGLNIFKDCKNIDHMSTSILTENNA